MLRIQIKGVGENGKVDFTGGSRSGQQINRDVKSRKYKENWDMLVNKANEKNKNN